LLAPNRSTLGTTCLCVFSHIHLYILRDSLALNSILIRIQHQVVFIPALRAAHLLAAMFAVGAVLATSAPAAAKHGEREVFEGGHGNGRHLGWYKHGRPAFADPAYSRYSGNWVGRRAWGGGAWGWQSGVIAGSAAWGVAWGLGPRFALFAPPVVFVPSPVFVSLPPVVVSVPWMEAPGPYYAPPPVYAAPVAAAPPADNWAPTPEALLCAALPPPVAMLPPPDVMIRAGPPPVIFSPPAYALSVWPVLAFAPPMLAVAVLHDEWWTGRYLGRGGYHAGGFYASRGYAGGLYETSAVIATGFAGGSISQRHGGGGFAMGRPAVGFQPGGRRGHVADFGGHGHGGSRGGGGGHGGGNGHDH
jgi:hypothetical protein